MTEKTFVNRLMNNFLQEGYLARKEIGVGHGVADLVLLRKSKIFTRRVGIRKSYMQLSPLLREEYFRTLRFISEGPRKTSLDSLIKKTHLSRSLLKYSILKSLEQNGYVKSVGKNYYFKINGWIPLASELIAIEAKLKDWRRGLVQANRYKVFANKVYLAVPSSIAHLVNKKMLQKHGLGLISFDQESNKKSILLSPYKSTPSNPARSNFAIEHFWTKGMLGTVGVNSVGRVSRSFG
ncbi:MAG: hypothetical protein HZB59_06855 [Ignavibacteriales bacterium]|nr:hypothetical protein [Ignavibacteriales bacterium]